jgi:hypothetical protein
MGGIFSCCRSSDSTNNSILLFFKITGKNLNECCNLLNGNFLYNLVKKCIFHPNILQKISMRALIQHGYANSLVIFAQHLF